MQQQGFLAPSPSEYVDKHSERHSEWHSPASAAFPFPSRRPPPLRIAAAVAVAAALVCGLGTGGAHAGESGDEDELPAGFLQTPEQILQRYAPFVVSSRIAVLSRGETYPCSDCHDPQSQPPNPRVRELVDEHDSIPPFAHSQGRFWCLRCHDEQDRDMLVDLNGRKISFDQSYLLCGQCHGLVQDDVLLGVHGKRRDSWRGPRRIMTCVECHNPHSPKFKQRPPFAPPQTRRGLGPPLRVVLDDGAPWDKILAARGWPVTAAAAAATTSATPAGDSGSNEGRGTP